MTLRSARPGYCPAPARPDGRRLLRLIIDGLAIWLALTSPEVELLAVTVVAGNVPVDQGVQGALDLIETAAVHPRADRPLLQDPRAWRRLLDLRRDEPQAQALWRDAPAATTLAPDPRPASQAGAEVDSVVP